jgi:hypothetical protein
VALSASCQMIYKCVRFLSKILESLFIQTLAPTVVLVRLICAPSVKSVLSYLLWAVVFGAVVFVVCVGPSDCILWDLMMIQKVSSEPIISTQLRIKNKD